MDWKAHIKMGIIFGLLLTSCLLSVSSLLARTITDNFSGASLNTGLWVDISQGGPSISQTSGQLQVTIPGTSTGDWNGNIQSKFILIGDFDVQADFSLLNWPADNGIRVGIRATGAVERVGAGAGFGEEYLTDFGGNLLGRVGTVDTSGALRMTRTGNILEGFYRAEDGVSWTSLGSWSDPTFGANTKILLGTWSGPPFFGGKDAIVAFKNFQVTCDQIRFNSAPGITSLLLLN
jgi:hypothetical protein